MRPFLETSCLNTTKKVTKLTNCILSLKEVMGSAQKSEYAHKCKKLLKKIHRKIVVFLHGEQTVSDYNCNYNPMVETYESSLVSRRASRDQALGPA